MPKSKRKKKTSQNQWKWWEERKISGYSSTKAQWKKLKHKGPLFAPLYKQLPRNVNFYYNGVQKKLSKGTEEVAGFYAKMLDDAYTRKTLFNKNFFQDWRNIMTSRERATITDLRKCDFKDIQEFYKEQADERKQLSRNERLAEKEQKEDELEKYGYCEVDGRRQKVGNFRIEPPGLFRGRGNHPKMGKLKERVNPGDVCLNIGHNVHVPTPSVKGKWKAVIHDNTVTWLASWRDTISNTLKYVFLSPSSKVRGEHDLGKFETARKLEKYVLKIRSKIKKDVNSEDPERKQIAVALHFIDKLSLRVGNEKHEGADTVGCCSLRVEHIKLLKKAGKKHRVLLQFPSKDSIPYRNDVEVEKPVYDALSSFVQGKSPKMKLFDEISTSSLNEQLDTIMPGLTAKVFRTYNASKLFQESLKAYTKSTESIPEKILAYNQANRDVAVLCNHKKTVSKAFLKSLDSMCSKIEAKLNQLKKLNTQMDKLKRSKSTRTRDFEKALDKTERGLLSCERQLIKLMCVAIERVENKNIAMGTSRTNYIDPRISIAWCKKWKVPVEKVFTSTLRGKFRWAFDTGANFHY